MRIAIDKGPLKSGHKVRGVGAYTRELADELKKLSSDRLKIELVDFEEADLSKYDLVHYPFFHPYFLTLPSTKPTKTVVTIHDLIPLIYPNEYPPGLKGKFRFALQKGRVKKADGIITPSETSKKDVVRFLGIPQEKINVIYEAPREIFKMLDDRSKVLEKVRKKYRLPKKFVLYVGDVNYNKNILGLASACKIAKLPLVIVGKQAADENVDLNHPENKPFTEFLSLYGKEKNIKRLGYVPDSELVGIYNLTSVYCQPSFYEGFGLSILEAMVCGTPVVVTKTQAIVEVTGGAAIIADPNDSKDISEKLKLAIKKSDSLRQMGLERAKEFSWTKTAEETIEYYQELIESK